MEEQQYRCVNKKEKREKGPKKRHSKIEAEKR
jgi:hypothetical protein